MLSLNFQAEFILVVSQGVQAMSMAVAGVGLQGPQLLPLKRIGL
jgi:hypothetical protein